MATPLQREAPLRPDAPSIESSRRYLQRRARRNLRNHWLRDATRVSVLALSDLAALSVVVAVLALVRQTLLGTMLPSMVGLSLPVGFPDGAELASALLISLLITGAYGAGDRRRDTGLIFEATVLCAIIFLFHEMWDGLVIQTIVEGLAMALGVGAALVYSRRLVDWVVARVRPRGKGARTVVVSQPHTTWQELADLINRSRQFLVVGSVVVGGDKMSGDGAGQDHDLRAGVHALGWMIERTRADTVLLWGELPQRDFSLAVDLALASGCRLLAGPRGPGSGDTDAKPVWIDNTALVELSAPHLTALQLALKRTMDIVGAVVGLVIGAPLVAIISIVIKLDSPGPVYFRQWRIGRAGEPFRIFKFRSMVVDAESRKTDLRRASIYGDGRLFKILDDPRVTRVGKWLRRTSLDELPQLINVLLGQMALVGPRPPVPSEVEHYEEHHFCRFDMKPGITGPWQVNGRNTITDFEKVVRLESQYIRKWNIGTDVAILLRTIPVVLGMRGAH